MVSNMLLSLFLTLSTIGHVAAVPGDALFARQACNADNCLRAVRGNANGAADCSSFLLRRVNSCGPATTTTTTTTITSNAFTVIASSTTVTTLTSTTSSILRKRQMMCTSMTVTPTNTPSYASRCVDTVRYSNACACIGVSTSSTTIIVPSMTSTSTVSVTASATTTTTSIATSTSIVNVGVSTSSTSSTSSGTSSTSSSSSTSSTSSTSSSSSSSSTTSSTTSSASSNPTTPAFRLVVPGGRRLRTATSDRSLMPVQGGSGGDLYTIINGEVHNYANTASRWSLMTATSNDIIYDTTDGTTFTIRCQVANPSTQTGQLNCVGRDSSQVYFQLCNEKVTLSKTYSVAGCAAIDLQAVSSNN